MENKNQFSSSFKIPFYFMVLGVLLIASILALYRFYNNKSTSERNLLLKDQTKKLEKTKAEIRLSPENLISPTRVQKLTPTIYQLPTETRTKGAELKEIKYSLPEGWKAEINRSSNGEESLWFSPINQGGHLIIKVYSYDMKTDIKKYYCQLTNYCIEETYFIPMMIGNISGYEANALDNSGGGFDYFGVKDDKFYIINRLSPSYPPINFFDQTYKQVLNSLVF